MRLICVTMQSQIKTDKYNDVRTLLDDAFARYTGYTEIPAQGQPFDPKYHNAVMHVEDESLGQNVVAEVFQTGFQCGEKVIRFAMVKVAN